MITLTANTSSSQDINPNNIQKQITREDIINSIAKVEIDKKINTALLYGYDEQHIYVFVADQDQKVHRIITRGLSGEQAEQSYTLSQHGDSCSDKGIIFRTFDYIDENKIPYQDKAKWDFLEEVYVVHHVCFFEIVSNNDSNLKEWMLKSSAMKVDNQKKQIILSQEINKEKDKLQYWTERKSARKIV